MATRHAHRSAAAAVSFSLPLRTTAQRRAALLLGLLATVALAGVLVLVLLANNSEVIDKGRLLSFTPATVYQVRFFERFDVLVQPENKPSKDALTAYILVGIAFMALTFAVLHLRQTRDLSARPFWFFASLFIGANYLAADEFLGIHESLGANLLFLRRPPLIEHPDDLIIVAYGVFAVLFFFAFRGVVLASRTAVFLASAAVGLCLVSVFLDLLRLPFEEIIEIASAGCLIWLILVLGLEHVAPAPP